MEEEERAPFTKLIWMKLGSKPQGGQDEIIQLSVRLTKRIKDEIDAIIEQGYYLTASEFIRAAIMDYLRELGEL